MSVEICRHFIEHPGWRTKHPTGPVTWDGWCSHCGFKLEDKQFSKGIALEGSGRRLERVVETRGSFQSRDHFVACSECCPNIKRPA